MTQFTPTERTKVRRKPDRASYDREAIYRILDEAFVCQVGFIADGQPVRASLIRAQFLTRS